MNADTQRILVLTHLGWTDVARSNPNSAMRGTTPKGVKNQIPPNHVKNLNACRDMEMTLTDDEQKAYEAAIAARNNSGFLKLNASEATRVAAFIEVKGLPLSETSPGYQFWLGWVRERNQTDIIS